MVSSTSVGTMLSAGVSVLAILMVSFSNPGKPAECPPSGPEPFITKLEGGLWRTVGVENKASGKFEFDQSWIAVSKGYAATADASWYPDTTCHPFESYDEAFNGNHMALLNCTHKGGNVNQYCLVDIVEGFHSVDVAFVACNHSGSPAPKSFQQAMNTPSLGNFFMVRCKPGTSPGCNFTAIETGVSAREGTPRPSNPFKFPTAVSTPSGVPELLKGSWRAMEISQGYSGGIARVNFTVFNKASIAWPNYQGSRAVTNFAVFSSSDTHVVLQNVETGGVQECLFDVVEHEIVTYGLLTCGPEGAPGPQNVIDGLSYPNMQFAMARCNRGSEFCEWSFGSEIDGPHHVKYTPRGQPCAVSGPAFRPSPRDEARMKCTVGRPGEFTDYQLETQCTSCTPTLRTLHGLWPDYDGQNRGGYSWPQYCAPVPFNMSNITNVPGLKAKMAKFWPSCPPHGIPPGKTQEEANEMFWEHEWDRHGSCAPSNFGVAGYFATVVAILEEMSLSCKCGKKCTTTHRLNRSYVNSVHAQVCGEHNEKCGGYSINSESARLAGHVWCQRGEACWPTPLEIAALRAKLDPAQPRNIHWKGYPEQGQTSAVPLHSINDQALYGLGDGARNIEAIYTNDDTRLECYTQGDQTLNNYATSHCKASTRNQPYNGWEPAFIVFAQTEEHLTDALQFAVDHQLCIMVAGTGHDYLNRHSCPSGGFMIRTTAMQDSEFIPKWDADPALSPHGAFRFSPGVTFSLAHQIAAQNDRVISSGWCVTVGLIGWSLGGGHGPLAPSMGLGVDNTLEFTVLQVDSNKQVVKRTVSATENSDLLWAMKGGGGSTWGLVTSITVKAHVLPDGGVTRYFVMSEGDFCEAGQGSNPHNWAFLQNLNQQFADWMLTLNSKFAIQASIWPSIKTPGQGCSGAWQLKVEYFYAGAQTDPAAIAAYDSIIKFMEPNSADETANTLTRYANYFEYVASFKGDQFAIRPAPAAPTSNVNTGAQSSVLVPREKLATEWVGAFNDLLALCPTVGRCPFHFMYLGFTGNVGSPQPNGTALSPGMRTYAMAHNARQLSELELENGLFKLSPYSYFSESPYYMRNWGDRYWGKDNFARLQEVKRQYDPLNVFWCHHCIGDDPKNPN